MACNEIDLIDPPYPTDKVLTAISTSQGEALSQVCLKNVGPIYSQGIKSFGSLCFGAKEYTFKSNTSILCTDGIVCENVVCVSYQEFVMTLTISR